jgi:hypothetical protein
MTDSLPHKTCQGVKSCEELERASLGDVGGDAPGLVTGEQMRSRAPAGLILEIDVGRHLPVVIADDVAGVGLLDGPRADGKK